MDKFISISIKKKDGELVFAHWAAGVRYHYHPDCGEWVESI